MTEKQRNCIDWICQTLGVKYYGGNNFYNAQCFISRFINRAREVHRESNFYSAWGLSYQLGHPLGGGRRCKTEQ